MLSLKDRADAYSKEFPKYPPLSSTDRWLYGIWVIGNTYKRLHGYYGEYPPSYLRRVKSLFPDCDNILQLFGDVVHEDITLDINPELSPTVVGTAHSMPFADNKFDLIIADPPYSKEHAAKYNYPMINRRKTFKECYRVLKPGGFLVWLDWLLPMYRKDEWLMVGTIGIVAGTNRKIRGTTIYQKQGSD